MDNLFVDNVNGAKAAIQYLIERGHRRIAMIAGTVVRDKSDQRSQTKKVTENENDKRGKRRVIFCGARRHSKCRRHPVDVARGDGPITLWYQRGGNPEQQRILRKDLVEPFNAAHPTTTAPVVGRYFAEYFCRWFLWVS